MIRFSFDERKAAQAAAYLIARKGGQINYMLLIKLMYMAERASLLRRGRTITGDDLYALKDGPVLSRVLNLIRQRPSDVWSEYVLPREADFTVSLRTLRTSELSESEIEILDEIFNQYGGWDPFDLRDHLHKILPEWRHPGITSIMIDPAEILRLERKTQEEIDLVESKAREDRFFDQL